MDYEWIDGGVTAPRGLPLRYCGIRKNRNKGLGIDNVRCSGFAAAVFTQNKVIGAPCIVTKRHLKDGMARIICNNGIANTCAADGIKAEAMCGLTAGAQHC